MAIAVFYPMHPTDWMCHLANNGRSLCGAKLHPNDWYLHTIASIVDAALCPACLRVRAGRPMVQPIEAGLHSHCVYIMRVCNSNYYKVGITSDAQQRRAALQQANPVPIVLVWQSTFCDPRMAKAIESHVHTLCAHTRAQGEWFQLKPDEVAVLQDLIETLVDTRGSPGLSGGLLKPA